MPKTDMLRHVTTETGNVVITARSDIQDHIMSIMLPKVQDALDGKSRV